jgi:opacity protein-like surface antigen
VRTKIGLICLLLWTATASAQRYSDDGRDRLIIGGNAGIFRISFNDFTRVYDKRSGITLGGTGLLKIRVPYYLAVKYRHFEKDGSVDVDNVSQPQSWKENWYTAGVRYLSYGERKVISYFGFGFAFFNIKETGTVSVFGREPGKKRNASGFFLDGGLEYRFSKYASLDFEIEVTSAGLEGKSGFEGSSVGGYLFSIGAKLFVL